MSHWYGSLTLVLDGAKPCTSMSCCEVGLGQIAQEAHCVCVCAHAHQIPREALCVCVGVCHMEVGVPACHLPEGTYFQG